MRPTGRGLGYPARWAITTAVPQMTSPGLPPCPGRSRVIGAAGCWAPPRGRRGPPPPPRPSATPRAGPPYGGEHWLLPVAAAGSTIELVLDIDPSTEIASPTRRRGQRFRRRADAITQAEIRRLLSSRAPAPHEPDLRTVQEELRRLSASRTRPVP